MLPKDLDGFAERYAGAWCSQNAESVAAFFSESGSLSVNGGDPAVGRKAICDVAQGFMTAFPNMHVSFDKLATVGDRIAFHWTLSGANTGPGGSGSSVRISGREIWRFGADGLVAESLGSFDAEDYARQLAGAARS